MLTVANRIVADRLLACARGPQTIDSPEDWKAATTSSSLWTHNGGQWARSVLTHHHGTCLQQAGRHKWRDLATSTC